MWPDLRQLLEDAISEADELLGVAVSKPQVDYLNQLIGQLRAAIKGGEKVFPT